MKQFTPLVLVVTGTILFLGGLLYNATQFMNVHVPLVLSSSYLVGYAMITAAFFMYDEKKVGYTLIGLFGVYVIWIITQIFIG
jgi:hypothetical protein